MSSTSFQDRFKGKTVLMTKEGVDGVIKDSDNPIPKAGGPQPYRMDDFTSHLRQINSKKEAQTFDNARPFYHNPTGNENTNNMYSATYSKPQGNQGGFRTGNGSNKNLDSIDQQMEHIKAAQLMQQQIQMQMQMKQQQQQQQQMSQKKPHPPVSATEFNRVNTLAQSAQSTPFKVQPSSINNSNQPGYQQSFQTNKQFNYHPDSADPLRSLISNTVPVSLYTNNQNQNQNNGYQFNGQAQNYPAGSSNSTATSIAGKMKNNNNYKTNQNNNNNFNTNPNINNYEQPQQQFNPYMTPSSQNSYQAMFMPEPKLSIEDAYYQLNQQYQPQQDNGSKNGLYKPYTLNEYKNLQKGQNYKVGGLGPNIGNEDWSMKKEQAEKRIEFAKNIQQINSQVLRNQQEQGKIAVVKATKQISSREKAIEFAKNIPKPPVSNAQEGQQLQQPQSLQPQHRSVSHTPFTRSSREIDSEEFLKASNKEQHPDIEELEKHHLDFLNQIEKISK